MILQNIKRIAEKATGRRRPEDPQALLRECKAQTYPFNDDGVIPNHPRWPLIIYKRAVRLPECLDPAAVFEELFESRGWGSSWRDGIYDYAHYHSRTHEVLGIARGSGRVRFGGKKGRALTLKAGDVAILPAGTGHQRLNASEDFLVVGASGVGRLRRVHVAGGSQDSASRDSESHAPAQGPRLRQRRSSDGHLASIESSAILK